jgi:hypothetical protein
MLLNVTLLLLQRLIGRWRWLRLAEHCLVMLLHTLLSRL